MQPAEPALSRQQRGEAHELLAQGDYAIADINLPVVGRNDQTRAGRQDSDEVGHQSVGRRHLIVVGVADAVLMGDLVDAVVVAVHERLAVVQQPPHPRHQRRRHAPAVQPHTRQVGTGEAGLTELGARDDRRASALERLNGLEFARWH